MSNVDAAYYTVCAIASVFGIAYFLYLTQGLAFIVAVGCYCAKGETKERRLYLYSRWNHWDAEFSKHYCGLLALTALQLAALKVLAEYVEKSSTEKETE